MAVCTYVEESRVLPAMYNAFVISGTHNQLVVLGHMHLTLFIILHTIPLPGYVHLCIYTYVFTVTTEVLTCMYCVCMLLGKMYVCIQLGELFFVPALYFLPCGDRITFGSYRRIHSNGKLRQ